MSAERPIDTRRFRQFVLPGDWLVLVGKTDEDNDYLSLEFAQPDDYWFHVDGHAGAHVLLLHKEGESAPRPIVESAAAIAAYYSKARNAKRVGVGMTRARAVGKRRGSPAGQVTVAKEEILRVVPALPLPPDSTAKE